MSTEQTRSDIQRQRLELKKRAWDHGLREGGLYHEKCPVCVQIKRDFERLREAEAA